MRVAICMLAVGCLLAGCGSQEQGSAGLTHDVHQAATTQADEVEGRAGEVRIASLITGSYVNEDYSVGGKSEVYSGDDSIFAHVRLKGQADDLELVISVLDSSGNEVFMERRVVSVDSTIGSNFTLTRSVKDGFNPGEYVIEARANGVEARNHFIVSK